MCKRREQGIYRQVISVCVELITNSLLLILVCEFIALKITADHRISEMRGFYSQLRIKRKAANTINPTFSDNQRYEQLLE